MSRNLAQEHGWDSQFWRSESEFEHRRARDAGWTRPHRRGMIPFMPKETKREDSRGREPKVDRDPEVARVVETMSSDLGRAWTVEALAKAAGMSRPTLARRFVRAVGEAPLQHLARLRMERAAQLLDTTDDALSRIA